VRRGRPRANVVMKAGDCAAMPADIRHQGYSAQALDAACMGEQFRSAAGDDRPRRNAERTRDLLGGYAPRALHRREVHRRAR
jgi:hypothetical protein